MQGSRDLLPEGDLADFIRAGHISVFAKSGAGKSKMLQHLHETHPFVGVYVTPHNDLPKGRRITPANIAAHLRTGEKYVWKAPTEEEIEGGRDGVVAELAKMVRTLLNTGARMKPARADSTPEWCVVTIDEVHNFTNKNGYIGPVERLLSEGRKFGVKVIVASQRPARVSLEVIGQTEHKIFLELEPPDAKYLEQAGYPVSEFEEWTMQKHHFVILRKRQWVPYLPMKIK